MCIPLSAEKTCRTRALAIGCLGTAVLAAYLLRLCAMFPVAVCCSLKQARAGRQLSCALNLLGRLCSRQYPSGVARC